MPRLRTRISVALAFLLALTSVPAFGSDVQEQPALGLMGTIPIYWGEAGGIGDVLSGEAEPHWARARLEQDFKLRPLTYLDADALAEVRYLLLAQPRALSGEENVALDAWVRQGGHLLLFADPMMTGHSAFPLGDRRRPQDVTLLSPLLRHWGLEMDFDHDQAQGTRIERIGGLAVPVNLPGEFAATNEAAGCKVHPSRIMATCRIESGTAVILADAAMLDLHEPDTAAAGALAGLVHTAFEDSGEIAGQAE